MADDAMTTRTVKAYHEAGHAVYAYLVGMTLESVDGNKNAKFSGDMTTRDHVKSLFAGQVAERLSPLSDPTLVLCVQDYYDMLKPLAGAYVEEYGGDPQDEAESARRETWSIQFREECLKETEALLRQPAHQKAVTALAELLVEEGIVSGERATQVIAAALSASTGAGATEVQSPIQHPAPSPKPHRLFERLLKWVKRR